MSKLSTMDLAFLLLETQHRPTHMASCVVFEPRGRNKARFVAKLLKELRSSKVGKPFNQKVKWLDDGVASWEKVEPDLNYHVRHVAIPAPGNTAQLDDTLALLNAPLLDRAYPLWQCFVVEGLEHGRFALFFKIHHAIVDGEGGIKLFRDALSDDPKDRRIRPIWLPAGKPPKRAKQPVSQSQLERISSQVNALPAGVAGLARGLLELGAQTLNLKSSEASMPFQAPASPFNVQTLSSARSYASCEIPLDGVQAMARASACTVNDVVMTLIDDALHKYMVERGHSMSVPLVAAMAVSTRTAGQDAAGNQVSGELVPLGQPHASVATRLQQVHEATVKVKERARARSTPMRQLHSLILFGAATLPEITPGLTAAPSYNLLISNMAGPREQLYLGGASLVAFRGMPIVPPNPGLNVTFLSIQSQICLAVGCTPESMRDPGRYIELLLESWVELGRTLKPKKAKRKLAVNKKTSAKKSRAGPAAQHEAAAKKKAAKKAVASKAARKPVKKKVPASKPPGKTTRKEKVDPR